MLIFETTIYCNLEAKEKNPKQNKYRCILQIMRFWLRKIYKKCQKNQARTFPYPSVKRRVKQTK